MSVINLFGKPIKKLGGDYIFILEAGTNHYELADCEGISVRQAAEKMIIEAATTGADAIKFQAYNAESLASNLWAKEQYAYMRRRDSLDIKDYIELIKYGKKIGIKVFYTLFDEYFVKMLGEHVDVFKVASPDITNFILLEEINKFKKSVILSTAGADFEDIWAALELLKDCNVAIMHCRAIYPTPEQKLDLGIIRTLNSKFPNNVIGWSSHIPNAYYAPIAMSLGANVLEYHFKPNLSIMGGDYPVSITKSNAVVIKRNLTELQMIYGNDEMRLIPEEEPLRQNGRRGLYAIRTIDVGERVEACDFIPLRPAYVKGFDIVKANEIEKIKNKRANVKITKGTPLFMKFLEVISD
jgi:sialic acid synthase SpsE